jgi:hypothetical protein
MVEVLLESDRRRPRQLSIPGISPGPSLTPLLSPSPAAPAPEADLLAAPSRAGPAPPAVPLFGLGAAKAPSGPLANLADEFMVRRATAGTDTPNAAMLGLMAPLAHASYGSSPRQTDQLGNAADSARATDKLRARDGISAYTRLQADAAGSSAPRYQSRGSA